MNDISIHRTRTQFSAAVDSLHRAVQFKAWRVTDDGQKRAKSVLSSLPIEGPRYPANLSEASSRRRTGRFVEAPGYELDVADATTLKEAIDKAAPGCGHKDHLMVLETDAGRNTNRLHVYAIKQDSRPRYRGHFNTERYHELYAFHLFDVDVAVFAPCEPWKLTRDSTVDEIVGRDPTLVEQR